MSAPNTATVLVSCPDRPGLVAALAQVLYGHGANILAADQHTDSAAGRFVQRIRFDAGTLHKDRLALQGAIAEVAGRFDMSWRIPFLPTFAGARLYHQAYERGVD